MSTWRRLAAALFAFALLGAACGDDDTTTTDDDAGGSPSEPADDAMDDDSDDMDDGSDDMDDGSMDDDAMDDDAMDDGAGDPAEFAATNGIPVPDWLTLAGFVEASDGELVLVGEYETTPPPGYDTALTDAGWTIVHEEFGSIPRVAWHDMYGCLPNLTNYTSPDAAGGWILFRPLPDVGADDCEETGRAVLTLLGEIEPPFAFVTP